MTLNLPYALISLDQMTHYAGQFYIDNPFYADNRIYPSGDAGLGADSPSYLTGYGGLNFGTMEAPVPSSLRWLFGYSLLGTPGTGYFWNPSNVGPNGDCRLPKPHPHPINAFADPGTSLCGIGTEDGLIAGAIRRRRAGTV